MNQLYGQAWRDERAWEDEQVQRRYREDVQRQAEIEATWRAAAALYNAPPPPSAASLAAFRAAWEPSPAQQAWARVRWSHEEEREQTEEG